MYYKLNISRTSSNTLAEDKTCYDKQIYSFATIQELIDELVNQYGKKDFARLLRNNKVYIDRKSGEAEQIGFCVSFWNSDYSHNTHKWHQTDWIDIVKVEEQPAVNDLLQALKEASNV